LEPKREGKFAPVIAQAFRFVITEAMGIPGLWEIEVRE
jgi:hypothetical protein